MAKKKNKQFSNNNNSDQFQSVINEVNNFDNIQQIIPIDETIFIDELIVSKSEYWVWTVNNCSNCMLLSAKDYFNKFSIN